jgi:hypothetical protein
MNTLIYIYSLLILIFIFNIYSDMSVEKEPDEKADFTKLVNPIGFLLVLYLLFSLNSSKKGTFSM